jgi:uracil permease
LEKKLDSKTVVLGLQHTIVMFGATVLVPLITGLDVGVTLLAAGVGTWLFHILTKFKVPVFLGSSFAFIPPILAITASTGDIAYATGGILIAGLMYVVVSFIFKFVSYETLHKILPPSVTGPMIILIGMMLANVAISNANGSYSAGLVEKIGVNGAWGIALFTFAVAVVVKSAFKGFLSALPVLIALVLGYILAVILGVVDFSGVASASWVGLPGFMLPKFAVGAIMMTVPMI